MATVVVDDSCLQAIPWSVEGWVDLGTAGKVHTAQVRWLGLRVDGQLVLFYIHQMNQVNSHNDLGHDDYTINIVNIIIIIIWKKYWQYTASTFYFHHSEKYLVKNKHSNSKISHSSLWDSAGGKLCTASLSTTTHLELPEQISKQAGN